MKRFAVVLQFLLGLVGCDRPPPKVEPARPKVERPPPQTAAKSPPSAPRPRPARSRFEPEPTPATGELLVLETHHLFCRLTGCSVIGDGSPQWRGLYRDAAHPEYVWCKRLEALPDDVKHLDLFVGRVSHEDGTCLIKPKAQRWSGDAHPIRPLTASAVGEIPIGVPRAELERRFPERKWDRPPFKVTFGKRTPRALYVETTLDQVGEQLAIPSLPLLTPTQAAARFSSRDTYRYCGQIGGASAFREVTDKHKERMALARTPVLGLGPSCFDSAPVLPVDTANGHEYLVAVAPPSRGINAMRRGTVRRAILESRKAPAKGPEPGPSPSDGLGG